MYANPDGQHTAPPDNRRPCGHDARHGSGGIPIADDPAGGRAQRDAARHPDRRAPYPDAKPGGGLDGR